MRQAFCRTLVDMASRDGRIVLLTGDLGFTVLEPFAERFPDRFYNVGVAEQNMVGIATGLAEAGFIPFVYSIATFAALRPYEFIRNGPVLQRLPVRIVGVGGGFEYGHAGSSHYGLEDIGVLRLQPGLTVVAPADYQQATNALWATRHLPGPAYFRLSKDDQTTIPELRGRFALGRLEFVASGADILLIASGVVAPQVAEAARLLAEQGVAASVAILSSFNPAPVADLANALARFRLAVTVEAHYVTGGLGSLVAEVIAERALRSRLVRCGVKGLPTGLVGGQAYMDRSHGLSSDAIAATALAGLDVVPWRPRLAR